MLDAASAALMRAFHHVNFNTGDVGLWPRGFVPSAAVRAFFPAIRWKGGAVPGMAGWNITIGFPPDTTHKPKRG